MKDWPVGENFGGQWHTWWGEMLPKSLAIDLQERAQRKAKGEELGERQDVWWGEWNGARKSGPNGYLLAALGLAWWGSQIYAQGGVEALKACETWVGGVEEMEWAIKRMLQPYGTNAEEMERGLLKEIENAEEDEAQEAAEKAEKVNGKKGKGKKGKQVLKKGTATAAAAAGEEKENGGKKR